MDYEAEDDPAERAGIRADGKPNPAYAAALGLISAPLWKRSLAFAVDAAIGAVILIPAAIGAVMLVTTVLAGAPLEPKALALPLVLYGVGEGAFSIYVLVQLIVHGLRGVTIGKALFGLRSVRATTLGRPGFWRIVLRAVVIAAAAVIVPLIGVVPFLLSPLWDSERRGRGWHDHLVGTWLVDARAGLNPRDEKAMRRARKRLAAPERSEERALPSLATNAGAVDYVPSSRSSSGVVGVHDEGVAEQPWQPPVVGAAVAPTEAAPEVRPGVQPTEPAHEPAASIPATEPASEFASGMPATDAGAKRDAPVAQSAPAPSTAAAVIAFESGPSYSIGGTGLIGRAPEPRAGEAVDFVIPVQDPMLSKTHLLLGVGPDHAWIIDRGSANGTQLLRSDGSRVSLQPEATVIISWGDPVSVGSQVFRVVRAAAAETMRFEGRHEG